MTLRKLPKVQVSTRTGLQSDITPRALERWSGDVRAVDTASGQNTISILDVIGVDFWGDGVSAKRISAALRSIGSNPVTVNVNSPGGDFFEGLAIYNLLREHPAEVTVNIVGIAASAASIIAMAGDQVRIARAGFFMIHNSWVMAAGDRNALREVADWLEPFDQAQSDVFAARTGIEAKDIATMLDKETWISGQAAVEQGFADSLLASDQLEIDPQATATRELRAERKHDILCAKAGVTKTFARTLLAELKGGKSGAAPNGTSGAADLDQSVADLLAKVKSI